MKSHEVMGRRCRLIALLQSRPHTVTEISELMEYQLKQVRRDRDWLIAHEVPVKIEGLTDSRQQRLAIPTKWNAARWLWSIMTTDSAAQ